MICKLINQANIVIPNIFVAKNGVVKCEANTDRTEKRNRQKVVGD